MTLSIFLIVSAALFSIAMRCYDADVARVSDVKLDAAPRLAGDMSVSTAS